MASAKEIIKGWQNAGYLVPDEYIDSVYSMKALTDELAEKKFLEKYGSDAMFKDADRVAEPTIPSMSSVIGVLGLADDPKGSNGARTKEQKFLEDFPEKLTEWKKKIVANPVYGKHGWETVKKIWQQAVHEKMLSDIATARNEAMDNAKLDFGLFQLPNIPGSSFLARTFLPRTTERLANTGDYSAKDILADLGENVAMAIPGGVFTGIAGKGLARVAPRVVNWASRQGPGIASNVLRGAARMGGNLFGNAVVPFATEGMDSAIYGDDDEGMEHRADFSVGDALIGTAINQGVNRGIMRLGGPMIDLFSPGGLAEGGSGKVRTFLETVGQPRSKMGDDFANSVAVKLRSPVVSNGEITDKAAISARTGATESKGSWISDGDWKKAIDDQAVLDAINDGRIGVYDKGSIRGLGDDVRTEALQEILEKLKLAKAAGTEKGYKIDEDDILSLAKVFSKDGVAIKPSEVFDIPSSVPIDIGRVTGNPKLSNGFMGSSLSADDIASAIARNPVAFINYATWHGKGPGAATILDKVGDATNQAVPSWFVNKYGSEGDATMLLAPFLPETKKAIDENRKEVHGAPRKRKKSAAAADILKGMTIDEELTAQDRKFLSAIEKNPDILKFGYKEDPDAFRLWLLEKGNSLLQSYPAFRPTFW